MSLANPIALALALLALPIVVLYILKVRPRRVPVTTTMFWDQVFEDRRPRSIWQRLRHLLSLLLQLVFLGLLVAALADPLLRFQSSRARRVVLVIDNSASMNATDVAPTRLDQARDEARRLVDALRLGDEMAVVSAGTRPRVRCGLTDHRRTLREAIASIPPSDGPTGVVAAVQLARRLLAPGGKIPRIVVLTDGGFSEAGAIGREPDVELRTCGGPVANVGLSLFQVRRSLTDPVGYEILAEITNASDRSVSCRLELDLPDSGEVLDVVPIELGPGARSTQVIRRASPEGGRLRARLDHADALPADNTAWALLPRREMQPVVLVTEPNLFLEKVFEALPTVDLTVVRKWPTVPPPSRGAVLVFHKQVPDVLPPNPVFVIDPARSTDLWKLGAEILEPVVATQDRDAPLMAHVRLENVLMPAAHRLDLQGRKPRVLAATADGDPLFAAIDRPVAPALVLTIDLERSDLPFQTAFPILAANAIAEFAGGRGELKESVATGATTAVTLPAPAPEADPSRLVLRAPDGSERALPEPSGSRSLNVGPLESCGVWTLLRRTGPGTGPRSASREVVVQQFACNLANRDESDLRPRAGITPSRASLVGPGGRPPWFYLLVVAGLLIAAEWGLYHRRWIA